MTQISISIDVPDLARATTFYSQALGCEKLRDEPPNITVLSGGNVEIYLLERPVGSKPLPNSEQLRSYDRHWTPIHLDFGVTNLAGSLARVLECGGSHEGSESGKWGSIEYCADPFGNGFCLIQE